MISTYSSRLVLDPPQALREGAIFIPRRSLFFNAGNGTFLAGPLLDDLDGDGRPDVVEANDCGTNAVHLWR